MSDTEKKLKEEDGTLNSESNGIAGDELEQVSGGGVRVFNPLDNIKVCPACKELNALSATKCEYCGNSL